MLGAGLHCLLTPDDQQTFGTSLHPTISVWRGFFIEFMLSFFLTLAYVSRDTKNGKKNYAESAIIIGLTYIALNAIGVSFIGVFNLFVVFYIIDSFSRAFLPKKSCVCLIIGVSGMRYYYS